MIYNRCVLGFGGAVQQINRKSIGNPGLLYVCLKSGVVWVFEISLLAKQGWRILEHPDSLIAKLYKAKYFPQSSFFDAPNPQSPSYSWRSILAAKDLIKHRMRWQIGTGTSVSTWTDPWLPKLPSFSPTPRL